MGCYYYSFSDVFSHGAWLDIESIEDPELKDLATLLPSIVMQGKAPATIRKYSGAFGRWKRWASRREGVPTLPAKPIHVALLPRLPNLNIVNVNMCMSWGVWAKVPGLCMALNERCLFRRLSAVN